MSAFNEEIPPWIIFHVPHDSTLIPREYRSKFLLTDEELSQELRLLTDHHTRDLFTRGIPDDRIVASSISRLVVDVERFAIDTEEPMASKGMGVIYLNTHDGRKLRSPPQDAERKSLLETWYYPHHRKLETLVSDTVSRWGKVLIIDCHSYPSRCLPYELNQKGPRPEICLGTDPFHTPQKLIQKLSEALLSEGVEVGVNSPFLGSLVPLRHFRKDPRVSSLMFEVRRDTYLNESYGTLSPRYEEVRLRIRRALRLMVSASA